MSYYPFHYFDDEFRAQTIDIEESLLQARECFAVARLIKESGGRGTRFILRAFAYLNRACELACVPLHLRPVETAQGIEMAWYTYRPVAGHHIEDAYFTDGTRIPVRVSSSVPDAAVMIGYEAELTETEARSRAIGW